MFYRKRSLLITVHRGSFRCSPDTILQESAIPCVARIISPAVGSMKPVFISVSVFYIRVRPGIRRLSFHCRHDCDRCLFSIIFGPKDLIIICFSPFCRRRCFLPGQCDRRIAGRDLRYDIKRIIGRYILRKITRLYLFARRAFPAIVKCYDTDPVRGNISGVSRCRRIDDPDIFPFCSIGVIIIVLDDVAGRRSSCGWRVPGNNHFISIYPFRSQGRRRTRKNALIRRRDRLLCGLPSTDFGFS